MAKTQTGQKRKFPKTTNLTKAQQEAVKGFEEHWWGLEFMRLSDVEDGSLTFDEAWTHNHEWILDHHTDSERDYSAMNDPEREGEF